MVGDLEACRSNIDQALDSIVCCTEKERFDFALKFPGAQINKVVVGGMKQDVVLPRF